MRVFSLRHLMRVYVRPRPPHKLAMAGDMIGVIVRLDHCRDLHTLRLGHRQNIIYHIQARVNHRAHLRVRAAHNITCAPQVLFDNLLEVHRCASLCAHL